MNKLPALRTHLLDLLAELHPTGIPLIIGGGYGIYLKTEYVRTSSIRTLLREWPESRSTNDLDIFLRPELLITPRRLAPLAEAIQLLGYTVIPSAKRYQFIKTGKGNVGEVKIDILTGPQSRFSGSGVKADSRRVHPNPPVGLHAHPVNEVPLLDEGLFSITLSGILSSGNPCTCEIQVPHPYTYLMMKIFAFNDRLHDESKEFGRYHALDLYSIVATTTEEEWDAFPCFRERLRADPCARRAAEIIAEHFSGPTAPGILRLRESRYCRPELQLDLFVDILKESFL